MVTKYFVVLLNVLMFVVGVLVLTLGLYGMNVGSQVSHLVSLTMPTLVMLLGVFLVLISAWGVYAAITEDPLLMQIYLGAMTILLVTQFVLSSISLARQADVDMLAYDAWDRAFHRDKDALTKFEKTYSCCGFASLYDRAVPNDCTDNPEFGFMFPCRDKISQPLKSGLKTLGTLGIILGLLEAIGLVMAVVLYSDFTSKYGERDASRLAETRHLLREGSVPAQQYSQPGRP